MPNLQSLARPHRIQRSLAWVSRVLRGRPPVAVDTGVYFDADFIDRLVELYGAAHANMESEPFAPYRHAHLRLPPWFRQDLDPWSTEYADQQHRLWQLIAGRERPYDPALDEQDIGWDQADPVRLPGYYQRRDEIAVHHASDHLIAQGMIMRHCGLRPGDHALEYGPGFGQTALALARLGVNVQAIDISPRFVGFVNAQAEHFNVPLQAHLGRFGDNPLPGQQYHLVWFYESFHHCVDFLEVVPRLAQLVTPRGRIILAGEPIEQGPNVAIPYPWGVRLHSEVALVMRQTGWFELGFTEPFLYELFRRVGFSGRRVDCEPTLFGRLHLFERETGITA